MALNYASIINYALGQLWPEARVHSFSANTLKILISNALHYSYD